MSLFGSLFGVLGALALGCQSAPPASAPLDSTLRPGPHAELSGERALVDLKRLTRFGPRVSGTRGASRARAYIRKQLGDLGVRVHEWRSDSSTPGLAKGGSEATTLVGVLEGDSPDVFLLVATYDTPPIDGVEFVGANDGASGAALVLELGRVLAKRPRPYSIWLAFIEGDGHRLVADSAGASSVAAADRRPGSLEFARQLADVGEISGVRLAVLFARVADPDLLITRDLRSHPVYREVFWQSARDLALGSAFAGDGSFDSARGGHHAFADHRLRRIVAIADNKNGPGPPPGDLWQSAEDTADKCSARSLRAVGVVTLEALDRIALRLAKIDRFSKSPVAEFGRGVASKQYEHLPAPIGESPGDVEPVAISDLEGPAAELSGDASSPALP